jgi:hypothetical protein
MAETSICPCGWDAKLAECCELCPPYLYKCSHFRIAPKVRISESVKLVNVRNLTMWGVTMWGITMWGITMWGITMWGIIIMWEIIIM